MSSRRACDTYYLKPGRRIRDVPTDARRRFGERRRAGRRSRRRPLLRAQLGEAAPPSLTPAGVASYGPSPPPLLTQTSAYPPGENCVFQVDATTGLQMPRLPRCSARRPRRVPLTAAQLTDGPWCPDAANANRWDADLLRIRSVTVTVRDQNRRLDELRGPAGVLFANGGTSRVAARWATDQEIRFQVSPRNMNLRR